MTSVLHFKQLHSLANFLIASMACAEWPWCSSAWSGLWRGAGTLEPDFVCFRVPVMWHFVTLLSSTCPSSPLTGTLLLLTPWSIHQVHGVCARGMCQHLLDPAHWVQRTCVLHRCSREQDKGISKCPHLHWKLSACYKSILDFDNLSIIFCTYFYYDNSV